MIPEIYEKILNDEGFLNDLWNTLGATDKLALLKLAGWSDEEIINEFNKQNNG